MLYSLFTVTKMIYRNKGREEDFTLAHSFRTFTPSWQRWHDRAHGSRSLEKQLFLLQWTRELGMGPKLGLGNHQQPLATHFYQPSSLPKDSMVPKQQCQPGLRVQSMVRADFLKLKF